MSAGGALACQGALSQLAALPSGPRESSRERPATESPVDALIDLLEARPRGDGWIARCPAHDDANPSLSIGESDDGNVLVHCFAGCNFADVIAAIGLRPHDLFSRGRPSARPHRRMAPKVPEVLSWGRQRALYAEHKKLMGNARKLAQLDIEKGVSRRVAESHCLGLDRDGRIVLPLRDEKGHPVSVERLVLPSERWGGPKLLVDRGCPRVPLLPSKVMPEFVVVAESAWDALCAESFGHPAVGAPGAGIWREDWSSQLVRQGVREAGVTFDCDSAGRSGGASVVASLRAAGVDAWAVDLDPDADDGRDLCDWLLAQREGGLIDA